MRALPRAAALATLATALLCVLALVLLPAGTASDVSDVAQGLAALAAAVGAGLHVRRCTDGRTRATWALLSAACLSWAAGEAYWCWYTLRSVDVVPFPSFADVGFLGFAVLAGAGLLVHPGRGGRVAFVQRALDALLTGTAVGLVSWLTTLSAVADAGDGASPIERILLLAYPSADVLLVVLTVLLLTRTGGTRTALSLVAAGIVALGVSDSSFAYLGAVGLYDGGLIDLGWIGGFLLIALAGACPEPAPQTARITDEPHRVSSPSVLPYVPVLVALAVVAALTTVVRPLTTPEMLTSCGIVLCLLARQYLAVRDNARLARELIEREEQLRRQAFSDSLTGLANRALFRDRLEHVLELHARDRRPVAVVYLDLDDFKRVNDSFGHAAGDELLVRVAQRVRTATRAGDTVARLGGDEFAILLEDGADPLRTAARIASSLRSTLDLADVKHRVRASIGVASVTAGEAAVSPDALLARADAAMYAAKRAGGTGIARYDTRAGAVVVDGELLSAP